MRLSLKTILPPFVVLVCLAAPGANAQQRSYPRYVGHVNDFANVIDAQTEQKIETILTNFENLTGAQIAAVTVQSLEGRPVEDYAIGLYRAWGIGAKSGANKDKGALLLIALQDRKTRLEVGYGLEGDLPDGLAGEIIRRMRPFLQQTQYSQGMYVGIRTLVDTLAQKWNTNVSGIEDRSYAYQDAGDQPQRLSGKGILVLLVLGLIFFLIMIAIARAGRKGGGGPGGKGGRGNPWWTYPIIFNGSGGTFGSGSYGGGGSWGGGGSDWGGFGGGSSGGGGASDSW